MDLTAIDRCPPQCCRLKDSRGHYLPQSYGEGADGRVYVTLAHGRDSTLPGVAVFGIDPEDTTPCNCGKWESPTQAQVEATNDRLLRETAHHRN